ncbi:hypothetical protein GCM10017688_16660 [Streptomyces ramulosus]
MSQATPPRDRLLLADTHNAVQMARLHTVDVLSRWGVDPDSIETAELLVSELATNAVRHPPARRALAGPSDRPRPLGLRPGRSRLASDGPPPPPFTPPTPGRRNPMSARRFRWHI